MARLVKDFDEMVKAERYVVKKSVGDGFPAVTVYDNRTGSDAEYYSIYAKPIKNISKSKDRYTLYI